MAMPAGKQIGPIAINAPRQPIVPDSVLNAVFPEVLTGPQYLAADLAEAAGSDTVVSQMRSAHDRMRTGFAAVTTALKTNDPAFTPEANFMKVKSLADNFLDEIARQSGTATESGKRTIEALDNDIRSRLQIADGSRSGEIRNFVREMKKAERLSFAYSAIESGDKETMAAILNGPAYLSGFTDDERATLRNRYAEIQAPDLIARKKVIRKALDINFNAFNVLLDALGKLFPKERVDEIAGRMNAAQEIRNTIFKP